MCRNSSFPLTFVLFSFVLPRWSRCGVQRVYIQITSWLREVARKGLFLLPMSNSSSLHFAYAAYFLNHALCSYQHFSYFQQYKKGSTEHISKIPPNSHLSQRQELQTVMPCNTDFYPMPALFSCAIFMLLLHFISRLYNTIRHTEKWYIF